MTFDPDRLGSATRAAWDLLLAEVSESPHWRRWSDVIEVIQETSPSLKPATISRLMAEAVALGLAERRGVHPNRELRSGTGEHPESLNAQLAKRLDERGLVGPGESTGRNLSRGEAVLDWIIEDVLPNVDVTTRSGRPGPWLAQLTRAIESQNRAAVAAAQLGVEERRVAVEEVQLLDIAAAVTAVLRRRGHDVTAGDIRVELAGELRAIEAQSGQAAS